MNQLQHAFRPIYAPVPFIFHSFTGVDAIFHRPWIYYPNAKPGTKEVLAAVPDVIRMYWLPFIGWQDAVLADGTYVDFRSSAALRASPEKKNEGGKK
jgi:hypothetical protein